MKLKYLAEEMYSTVINTNPKKSVKKILVLKAWTKSKYRVCKDVCVRCKGLKN